MPIKKIVSLKNVGRFKSLAAKGDVQFKRLTLIYGSNGHGKTTLAGVLRSLATGDRAYIDERATLGVAEPPEAEILLDAGLARFSNGAWTTTATDLEIFDSTFVGDNVFTGEHVGPDIARTSTRLWLAIRPSPWPEISTRSIPKDVGPQVKSRRRKMLCEH